MIQPFAPDAAVCASNPRRQPVIGEFFRFIAIYCRCRHCEADTKPVMAFPNKMQIKSARNLSERRRQRVDEQNELPAKRLELNEFFAR